MASFLEMQLFSTGAKHSRDHKTVHQFWILSVIKTEELVRIVIQALRPLTGTGPPSTTNQKTRLDCEQHTQVQQDNMTSV